MISWFQQLLIIIIIMALFQEENIFGMNASLIYRPQLLLLLAVPFFLSFIIFLFTAVIKKCQCVSLLIQLIE